MSELPTAARLMAAVDATWPAAEERIEAGWRLRRGAGGGKRVSAASPEHVAPLPEIGAAIAGLAAWGQEPLFRIADGEEALDSVLAARGLAVIDPVVIYTAPAAALDDGSDHIARVVRVACPLAIADEIWDRGGIGPGRRAVMARPKGPRAVLLSRVEDRPSGTAFVAVDGEVAMVHAIEVDPAFRRKGAGALLLMGAARFACDEGARWLALAVTEANAAARALYERRGMAVAARYHYRIAPGSDPAAAR